MALTRVTRLGRAVIGSLVVVGAVLVAPLAAHGLPHPAEPTPTSSAEVTVKLAALAKSSEQLAEQLDQAQIDITKAQKAAAAAKSAAAVAYGKLVTARHQLAESISAQYKAPSFSRTAALLASNSSDGYLQTVQSMSLLTQHQGEVETIAAGAIAASDAASKTAAAAVVTAEQKRAALTARRTALNAQTTKYKTLLATLTAAERAKYFTPKPAPAPTKVAQVFAAATAPVTTATPVANANAKVAVAAASKGAAAAIAAARAELGKPYVWGAGGPASFDCSGLTAWAWAAAGVSLPHNAAAQSGMGTAVAEGDLQPGDLVFFGSPAYHVGMYLGDGLMIHAPTSGDVVKVTQLSYMSDYSGARRFG